MNLDAISVQLCQNKTFQSSLDSSNYLNHHSVINLYNDPEFAPDITLDTTDDDPECQNSRILILMKILVFVGIWIF